MGHITVLATGGVGIENAEAFLAAGADILGVGGSLVNREAIANGDFQVLTDYAAGLVAKARK